MIQSYFIKKYKSFYHRRYLYKKSSKQRFSNLVHLQQKKKQNFNIFGTPYKLLQATSFIAQGMEYLEQTKKKKKQFYDSQNLIQNSSLENSMLLCQLEKRKTQQVYIIFQNISDSPIKQIKKSAQTRIIRPKFKQFQNLFNECDEKRYRSFSQNNTTLFANQSIQSILESFSHKKNKQQRSKSQPIVIKNEKKNENFDKLREIKKQNQQLIKQMREKYCNKVGFQQLFNDLFQFNLRKAKFKWSQGDVKLFFNQDKFKHVCNTVKTYLSQKYRKNQINLEINDWNYLNSQQILLIMVMVSKTEERINYTLKENLEKCNKIFQELKILN